MQGVLFLCSEKLFSDLSPLRSLGLWKGGFPPKIHQSSKAIVGPEAIHIFGVRGVMGKLARNRSISP